MTIKHIISAVLAVVIGLAIYGAYQYPQAVTQYIGSPVGTTFSNAKVAAVNITPSSASATSTSLYNGDASDRYITNVGVTCSGVGTVYTAVTGAGLDAWRWKAATTSTNAPTVIKGFGSADLAMNVAVGTTTGADGYTASSTFTQVYNQRWAAGTYLTFQPNATSSTAACQGFANYLAL